MSEFTAEQITAGIAKAIKARDFEAVPGLIRLLALQDPDAAQSVLDAVELASMAGSS